MNTTLDKILIMHSSSFFGESRVRFDCISEEKDLNPITGKIGIRSHHWITAFFLHFFGKISILKDSRGTVFYLNKNSLEKWMRFHHESPSNYKKAINSICDKAIQSIQQEGSHQPSAPPTPCPTIREIQHDPIVSEILSLLRNYLNFSSLRSQLCHNYSFQQAPFTESDDSLNLERIAYWFRNINDELKPLRGPLSLYISKTYLSTSTSIGFSSGSSSFEVKPNLGQAIYLRDAPFSDSIPCEVTPRSGGLLPDLRAIELFRESYLKPLLAKYCFHVGDLIEKLERRGSYIEKRKFLQLAEEELLRDFIIALRRDLIAYKEFPGPAQVSEEEFLQFTPSDTESEDSFEGAFEPACMPITYYAVYDPSIIKISI